jgi:carboxypeptidase Taq
MSKKWDHFVSSTKRIKALEKAMALHGWDQETVMPAGAGMQRAQTIGELSALHHSLITENSWQDLLADLQTESLSDVDKRQVHLMDKASKRAVRIPANLQKELSETASLSQQKWEEARHKGDAQIFLPWLSKMIDLKRQEADAVREDGQTLYEALLNDYEPGAKEEQLDEIFTALLGELRELLPEVQAEQEKHEVRDLPAIPVKLQEKYMQRILDIMQFDLQRGRLDQAAHPFTEASGCDDVRLTTRYREEDIGDALFSTMHEGGHGLYEQGLLNKWSLNPLGEAVSLGVHESQSRFWENQIGRSLAFWEGQWDELLRAIPQLGSWTPEEWWRQINHVKPSLIRVDADEMTYNFHVGIRFQLEKALLSKELEVEGLEEAWNQAYEHNLGIKADSPHNGFLQDVHWSAGLFGYFPTYTLGNLYSAQISQKLEEEGILNSQVLYRADFGGILDWLRTNIHEPGSLYEAPELMKQACGQELNMRSFIKYLRDKYLFPGL